MCSTWRETTFLSEPWLVLLTAAGMRMRMLVLAAKTEKNSEDMFKALHFFTIQLGSHEKLKTTWWTGERSALESDDNESSKVIPPVGHPPPGRVRRGFLALELLFAVWTAKMQERKKNNHLTTEERTAELEGDLFAILLQEKANEFLLHSWQEDLSLKFQGARVQHVSHSKQETRKKLIQTIFFHHFAELFWKEKKIEVSFQQDSSIEPKTRTNRNEEAKLATAWSRFRRKSKERNCLDDFPNMDK